MADARAKKKQIRERPKLRLIQCEKNQGKKNEELTASSAETESNCRDPACDAMAIAEGYCRFHYIGHTIRAHLVHATCIMGVIKMTVKKMNVKINHEFQAFFKSPHILVI